MNGDVLRQWANVIALASTIVVNALANALPINGQTTGQVSDSFPVFFVPAAYVFSIWGVIYLLLLAFVVYQALPRQREKPRLRRIGYLFVLTNVLNAVWLVLWHYELFPLTLVVMLALLATLIAIYVRLREGYTQATEAERWFVLLPFSVYLGWISVATIANASQLLYWLGWNGEPLAPQTWAAIMLGIATLLGALVAWTRRDLAYLLVFVWAFAGIAIKHENDPTVSTAAWVATVVVSVLSLWVIVTRPRLRSGTA